MITETGHFSLALALFVALAQSGLGLYGARRGDEALMRCASGAAVALMLLTLVSFGALTYAYVVSDLSLVNVATNSHSAKPMLYKISGVWGNHEGSLLLWVTILALFAGAVVLFGRHLPPLLKARVIAVQGLVAGAFLAFILFTSNPFMRLARPPLDGNGLNPLLQDPGLAFHPPFLYLGYVGFSMAFSFAIAALIEGRVDAAWARWVRPWTLAAWVFLTLGIALGSWWAYYELGWGGWWYWDPVENASFMPWLAGTALLHSALVVEKRDALKSWTILLAILTFSLSLLGTFLVRSGVITSVHSFASDPGRGMFILAMLTAVAGGSLTLYAFRAPALKAGGLFAPLSREGGLLLNNLLLSTAAGTVLLGTLYPLFVDALGGGKVSVGAPFYNAVFVPIMIPLVAAMAVGPLMTWKRTDLLGILSRMKFVVAATLLTGIAVWVLAGGRLGDLASAGGMALAAWLFLGSLWEIGERSMLFRASGPEVVARLKQIPLAAWGMTLSHAGLAIMIVGIVGSSAWMEERIQNMKVGETAKLHDVEIRLDSVSEVPGPNYAALSGTFVLLKDGKEYQRLSPERRQYRQPPRPTSETAIHSTLLGDYYTVIGEEAPGGGYVTRFYWQPLIAWMWAGALIMSLGGLVSLFDRRHRIGAPQGSRKS
ncbi:MAG: heme lyase CcmF/NrfE family subunit [Alphaproteobacteria bacterium]|nr:heme lyase CcmF/NrfE family subunit [Alphaproteobacteria bacterium]